jgi:signal transduction histidine kinase/ActR/RegA family two-component response regulator
MPAELTPIEARVLLLPPTSRDAAAIAKMLAGAHIACVVCPDVQELCSAVEAGAGAVVVSEESLIAGESALAACLTQQPVWSDLPIVVLSRSGAESQILAHMLASLGNVSVMERPVRVSTFLSVVRSALRARERQYQVREQFAIRERTEEVLRRTRAQQDLVVRGANVGIWYCPLPFDLLNWDETVKEHFHLPPDATVTVETFYERLHPDDREPARQAIDKSIAERAPYDIDFRTVSPDGRRVNWIRASGRAFYDDDGKPLRFDGITIDMTERVAAQLERERLLESERAARLEVERASRMKDEFLATLSHELRNPLNAILGWSQLLKSAQLPPEEVAEGIEIIERNARAQTQIIEDLLDMSRIISGKVRLDVRQIDLASVVRAAIDTVKPAADAKDIRIRPVLDPAAGPVSGDPSRLQQVFWNLLSNAVKFTPKGGAVQIVLERINSHLEVSVVDSGEGIPEDFLPHVFDRFRQADATTTRRHGGLGLGLAIVRQLVELHGGSVRAVSDGPGHGATFVVMLPLAAVHERSLPPRERRHPAAAAVEVPTDACADIANLRVLIVDDEPDSRALLRRLLEDCDAHVIDAPGAEEGYHLVKSEQPDVIVSDIGMPGEDGFSFIRRVRALPAAQGGAIPAIALTAYARAEDRINVVMAGFQHHLAKPVEAAELIAVLASLASRIA